MGFVTLDPPDLIGPLYIKYKGYDGVKYYWNLNDIEVNKFNTRQFRAFIH
jgi:hypothetical protein